MSVQQDQPATPTPPTNTNPHPDGQPEGQARPDPEAPAATDELETLRAELAEIEQKADEYLRLAQRTQADFINYRRRMDEERAQQSRDASLSVLQRLFPILDDFERAMASASDAERQSSWGQGLLLVERNLRGLLAAEGVEMIEAEGADFDPRLHEALGSAPSARVPEGHVLHVVRQGYRKGDRVLRPTQVMVAQRPG
ncbi:MAG: nucleotide exchange factor GrpE [Chloroflexi bacterium]|nr:nucleotide exchange factor GrpE [Chloroflexota bacterium]